MTYWIDKCRVSDIVRIYKIVSVIAGDIAPRKLISCIFNTFLLTCALYVLRGYSN